MIDKGIISEDTVCPIYMLPKQFPAEYYYNISMEFKDINIVVQDLIDQYGFDGEKRHIKYFDELKQMKIDKIKSYLKRLEDNGASDLQKVVFAAYMSEALAVGDKRSNLQSYMKSLLTKLELEETYKKIDSNMKENTIAISKMVGASVTVINDIGIEKLKVTLNNAECVFYPKTEDSMNWLRVKSNMDVVEAQKLCSEPFADYFPFAVKTLKEQFDVIKGTSRIR